MNESIKNCRPNGSTSCMYVMGMIGSSIYFIANASGFWLGALGILKAFVWPVYLVFHAFNQLGI